MTDLDHDEQTMADAFGSIRAPEAVGAYASRSPRVFHTAPGWLRPVAAIATVAVVGGAAGAYLGLRGNPGGGAAAGAGGPVARGNAAMAFDDATGNVVLFGGVSALGKALADTWTWDGSAWTQQHPRTSPPGRMFAQMAYDPASHDLVLFVGEGAGGASTTVTCSGIAIGAPSGVKGVPVPASPPGASSCVASSAPGPLTDTWTWDGANWHRATGPAPAVTMSPLAERSLATDPISGRVLLLGAAVVPPVPGSVPSAVVPPVPGSVPCPVAPPGLAVPIDCGPAPTSLSITTWAWTGSGWRQLPGAAASIPSAGLGVAELTGGQLVADPSTGRLSYFAQNLPYAGCAARTSSAWCCLPVPVQGLASPGGVDVPLDVPPGVACPATRAVQCCSGSVRTWNGSAWSSPRQYGVGPELAGATLTDDPAVHGIVLYTPGGQTWAWNGRWVQDAPAQHPGALSGAAAVFDARDGRVLMFGGLERAVRAGLVDATWAWDGATWRLVAGSALAVSPGGSSGPPTPTPTRGACPFSSPGPHPGQDILPICPLPTAFSGGGSASSGGTAGSGMSSGGVITP